MRAPVLCKVATVLILLSLALYSFEAQAAIDNANLFDRVLERYEGAAAQWAGVITTAASRLFWSLVAISMVWTFGFMALRKADLGEFFAEFIRFIVFTGFFFWILEHGPEYANSINESLRQLGSEAAGLDNDLSPSGIVDIGFGIFNQTVTNTSWRHPMDGAVSIVMAAGILIVLALVGVNLLLLLTAGWLLAYAGVFFLGFGGSRWTSEIAISYYKQVLALAAQAFAMVLIVGIGKTFIDDFYANLSVSPPLTELAVMVVVVVILLALVTKVPPALAAIVGGPHGAGNIGGFGAASALMAAGATLGMAAAGAAAGAAAVVSGGVSAAGGASAVRAAVQKATQNMANGTGWFSGSSIGGGTSAGSEGGSPLAAAMGSAGRMINTTGRFAADVSTNLAKGTASVGKARIADAKKHISENTLGGKIASAIRESDKDKNKDSMSTTDEDSLSAGKPGNASQTKKSGNNRVSKMNDEVAEFVNKKLS
jgi:type IV secretion system protein TrbL